MGIELVLNGLKQTDPRFYAGITKWLPLLEKTVNKICQITNQEPEDVFQDLLLALSSVNKLYDVPLYRFRGNLHEKVCEDGSLICLKALAGDHRWFWTMRCNVEFVKKCEFSSLLGAKIKQQCYDILKNKRRKKHGYSWAKSDRKVPKQFDGFVTNVWDVEKIIDVVEFDETFHTVSNLGSPESLVSYKQCVSKIGDQLAPRTFDVFRILLQDPSVTNIDVSAMLNMSMKSVKDCKEDLRQKSQDFRRFL